MSEAYYQLQWCRGAIRREIENAEFDEERSGLIEELSRCYYQLNKYGDDARRNLAFQDKAKETLDKIENKEALSLNREVETSH